MSEQPLPCPFCGDSASIQNDFGKEWWVQCDNLDSCSATDGVLYAAPAHAISAWNRRAAPDGWQLVPKEPTEHMIREALDCADHDPKDGPESEIYCWYQAMLKAAPTPPTPPR